MAPIYSPSIYLLSMLCVNINVGNRFDFASGLTATGDRFDNQFVDRQRPKIIIGFAVSHGVTVKESTQWNTRC